ncbi:MAG: hypothetical protein RL196_1518 [Actinomycetota bacterium]|jgi:glycosyltransferase involved in cell wall biosynthesis
MANVFIATNNGDIGGGEVMLLNVAQAARSLGHSITVVTPSNPNNLREAATNLGLQVIALEAKNRIEWVLALRKWRRKNRDGYLWCNGLVPAFATSFQQKRIVHLHQEPKGIQLLACAVAKYSSLVTLVPSEFMASKVRGSTVFENWVSEPNLSKRSAVSSEEVVVGFIGRLALIKGIDVLADAIAELNSRNGLPSYKLHVAGEPRFTSKSDQKVVGESLARISNHTEFLGWVDPGTFFAGIDIFVCPSVWQEPFGLVVAEAMASRVPYITTTVGALPEVSGRGYEHLVAPRDSSALASSIEELAETIRTDPNLIRELQSNQYSRWQKHFSPGAGAERVSRLLESLVRENP